MREGRYRIMSHARTADEVTMRQFGVPFESRFVGRSLKIVSQGVQVSIRHKMLTKANNNK